MSVASGGRILIVAMIGSVVTHRVTRTSRGRILRRPRPGTAPSRRVERIERAVRGRRAVELDTVASHWQLALDAAQRALSAAAGTLPASELAQRRRELVQERQRTAIALERLAQASLIVDPRPQSLRLDAAETTDAIGEAARLSCRAAGATRAPRARHPCATTRPLGSAPRSGRTGAGDGSPRRRTRTWPWCRPARLR
jgi:hypothetical protein